MSECQRQALSGDGTGRLLLDQIADKWSVLILAALCEGPLRFNAVKRCLGGITQKALTQSLRRLERNGLVARRVMPVSPIAVEYRVTPLGYTLKQPLQALHAWTVEHLPEVEQAQREFDARASGRDAATEPAASHQPRSQPTQREGAGGPHV